MAVARSKARQGTHPPHHQARRPGREYEMRSRPRFEPAPYTGNGNGGRVING